MYTGRHKCKHIITYLMCSAARRRPCHVPVTASHNASYCTLPDCRRTIYDDPFIRNYIEDLLKNIRTQVVLNIVQPYTRIRIPFISKHLNIPESDVEQLLVSLILDNRIRGHIDQVRAGLDTVWLQILQ